MSSNHRIRILVLTMLHFAVDFYGGVLTPLAEPTLTTHLGATLGTVLLLLGIGGIVANASQPLSAAVLPRKGLAPLLVITPLVASLAACIGLTHSLVAVTAMIMVSFVAIGVFHPEGVIAAQSVSGSRQGLGTAMFLSGGFLGYTLGAWSSAAWATRWGLSGLWLLAAPGVISAVAAWALGLHRLSGQDHAEPPPHIRHQIPFPLVFVLSALLGTSVSLVAYFITPFLVRRFGPEAQFWGGTEILAFGLAGAAGSYLWGHWSENRGRCRFIAVTQIAALPFLYLLLNVATPRMAPVWGGLLGFTMGSAFPLVVVLGRGAPGEASRLRTGLLIGGGWGVGSLIVIAGGKWVDLYPAGDPAPVGHILRIDFVTTVLAAALAFYLSRREPRAGAPMD